MNVFFFDERLPRGWLALAIAGLLLACLCQAAAAQDHITARAYWEEPCSPHTLEQVRQREFVPYTGMLARNYGPCAIWVRLRIDPGVGASAVQSPPPPLVLRILPTYLDQIELFDPLAGDAVRVTGDRHRPAADEYRSLALHFMIPAGDAPRDIWLRLASTSTRMLDVQALPLPQAIDGDRVQELAYSAYLALLVASLLWALLNWLQSRERVIGVFVFKHVVTLAWSVMLIGYARTLFGDVAPAGLIDTLTSVLVLSTVPASFWFDYTLLHEYHAPRRGKRALAVVVLIAFVAELLLMAAGQVSLALRINAVMMLGAVWVVFGLALGARPSAGAEPPALPKWWLVLLYGVIAATISPSVLVLLGVLPGHPLVQAMLFVHGLLTGVIMVALLSVRARRLARRHRAVQTQLAMARRVVQHERLHREEQEKLLDMLTHELKTPLAVVRMLLATGEPLPAQVAQIRRALTDMNDVIERCSQAEQLNGGRLQAQVGPCDVAAELAEFGAQWRSTQHFDLRVELPDPASAMELTDAKLLRIVLANLLDNACKYSPADSTVTARLLACPQAEPHGDGDAGVPLAEAGLRVRQGLAIEIENLPGPAGWPDAARVFDRYYRSPFAHR